MDGFRQHKVLGDGAAERLDSWSRLSDCARCLAVNSQCQCREECQDDGCENRNQWVRKYEMCRNSYIKAQCDVGKRAVLPCC